MKEVRIGLSPNMELHIRITNQMEKDYRECRKLGNKEEINRPEKYAGVIFPLNIVNI